MKTNKTLILATITLTWLALAPSPATYAAEDPITSNPEKVSGPLSEGNQDSTDNTQEEVDQTLDCTLACRADYKENIMTCDAIQEDDQDVCTDQLTECYVKQTYNGKKINSSLPGICSAIYNNCVADAGTDHLECTSDSLDVYYSCVDSCNERLDDNFEDDGWFDGNW